SPRPFVGPFASFPAQESYGTPSPRASEVRCGNAACHTPYLRAPTGSNIRRMTLLRRTLLLAWLAAAWIAGAACPALFGYGALPVALGAGFGLLTLALVRRAPRYAVLAFAAPALFTGSVLRYEASRPQLAADSVAHHNGGVAMRIRGVLRD